MRAEEGDGHDADQDAQHADADAEQGELRRGVAAGSPAVPEGGWGDVSIAILLHVTFSAIQFKFNIQIHNIDL